MKRTVYTWLLAVAVALAIVAALWLLWRNTENTLTMEPDQRIDLTPQQIQSIRDIGQWEFLAISDEELVDTMRRTLLGRDQLSRIYYGTLRIGIDMNKLQENWIQVHGDSVVLTLPPVGLLDERFIDEARTQSFHESGKWTALDREAMYQRARRRMMHHGLSAQNLNSARMNAEAQFRQLFTAMGFSHIDIHFAAK